MRKNNTQSDSLDLLLDAMCNVFGAILLVSILVAAISGTAMLRGAFHDADAEQKVLQEKIALKEAELAAVKAELELLESLAASRAPVTATPSGDLAQSIQRGETLAAQTNLLGGELLAAHAAKLENGRKLQAAAEFGKLHPARRAKAFADKKAEIAAWQSKVQEADARPEHFTPRILQAANRLEPWRFLIDKRIHEVGSNRAIRAGLPECRTVNVEHFQRQGTDFWRLKPIPDTGILPTDFDAETYCVQAPPERYFMELLVMPDAIAETAQTVQKLRRAGYRVNWRVTAPEGALVAERKGGRYEAAQ